MKINWFSPIPPDNSGIATVTNQIIPFLSTGAEITLWISHKNYAQELTKYAEVRYYHPDPNCWSTEDFRKLNDAYATVYNIGNNTKFHRDIWRASQIYSGIVILHDAKLLDLFTALCLRSHNDKKCLGELFNTYYNVADKALVAQVCEYKISTDALVDHYPLVELGFRNAKAIIVHSKDSFEIFKHNSCIPTYFLDLPYQAESLEKLNKKSNSKGIYHLILFGHGLRNRRVLPTIKALASMPQRNKFKLDIIGKLENKSHVKAELSRVGINKIVTLYDFLPEDILHDKLLSADLAFNLRYPTMGEASLSQLKIWEFSLPSLVTNIGYYQYLPSTTVAHINIETEVNDIITVLADFLQQPEKYQKMGQAGRALLIGNHKPQDYAQKITAIIKDIPNIHLLQRTMVKRFAKNCKDLSVPGIAERISKTILELIPSSQI